MNMETKTVLMSLLAITTAYFCFGYVSQKIQGKFDGIMRTFNEHRDHTWRDHDELLERIESLEKKVECCATQQAASCKQGSVSY